MLASSSSGNCAFVRTARTRLLIDAGLTRKETFERLSAIGEDPARLDAILITHEHSDHVGGLPALARGGIPVYLSLLTAPAIAWPEQCSPAIETFQAGSTFAIGDIEVSSFTIPHDAADPVGFRLRASGVTLGIVTDLGYIPDSIKFHLNACDLLLLESNHDLEMLKVGPYPWAVKQRVMGRKGHLSNDSAADFIRADLSPATSTLILGHLSESNNYPDLVRLVASQALAARSLATRLVVAEPRRQSELFSF